MINFRVTEQEYAHLQKLSEQFGEGSLSGYLRKLLLNCLTEDLAGWAERFRTLEARVYDLESISFRTAGELEVDCVTRPLEEARA